MKRSFSKDDIQMAKKYKKKCSTSLAIKQMQMKTTLRFYLIPVRKAMIKNTTTNVREDTGKKEPSYTASGKVSCTTTMEKIMEVPQKTNRTAISSSNTTPRDIPKGM
jgi:hypothetical protein